MLNELISHQQAVPFVPFVIVTSSGRSYEVPSRDHVTITGLRREVIVERDDGSSAIINLLHIVAIDRLNRAHKN